MKTLGSVALAVDEALARDHGAGDVGFADLGHVEKLGVAEILRANVARDRNRRGVDDAAYQSLNQKAHLVQLHDGDVGSGIEIPHPEHGARQRIGRRPDAGDADPFALELLRRFDFWIDDEAVERLVENRAHEQCVGAAQIGADAGIGDRLGDGHFAGQERLERENAAGVYEFNIEAVFLKQARVVGDPRDRLIDGDCTVSQAQGRGFTGFGGRAPIDRKCEHTSNRYCHC